MLMQSTGDVGMEWSDAVDCLPMKRLGIVAILTAGILAALLLVPPSGPRSLRTFDPDRVADLELDMWQAYYRKERLRLFRGLVTLLHEQNRYSWARALQAGFHLARQPPVSADMREGYDTVLPDLERVYTIQKGLVRREL